MPIKLTLQNATATTTAISVHVLRGKFALSPSRALRISGQIPFNSLSVLNYSLSFQVSDGASLNGSIEIPLVAGSGQTPSILINNVTGDSLYIEWPTQDGQTMQELTPGTQMFLADFVSDIS